MIIGIENTKIILSNESVEQLKIIYNNNPNFETGGILLGSFSKSPDIFEITEIYEIKTVFTSRIFYKRNANRAQKIVNSRWEETDGKINYLGEWHTHPNMRAFPSKTDFDTLKKLILRVNNHIPGVIMLILGKDKETNLVLGKGKNIYAYIFNR